MVAVGRFTSVAAAILAAVEGGILPPGPEVRNGSDFSYHTPIPAGRMPGSTAGKMPAATLNTYEQGNSRADALVKFLSPPSRRASVSASLRRDRAEARGEGGKAPLRRDGGWEGSGVGSAESADLSLATKVPPREGTRPTTSCRPGPLIRRRGFMSSCKATA